MTLGETVAAVLVANLITGSFLYGLVLLGRNERSLRGYAFALGAIGFALIFALPLAWDLDRPPSPAGAQAAP